jgi:methionine-gamma-lyase
MSDAIDPVDQPTPRRKPRDPVTTINGRPMKPSTLMMGYGYDPVLSEGSLKAPIFLTSTFAFENAAAGKRHFEGITGKREGGAEGLVYSRFNAPNQEILEDRLAICDGAEDALSFSSGMTAIAILMLAACKAGDVIVHSGPLYAASEGFVAKIMAKYGVTYVDFPAGATAEELDAVMAKAKAQAEAQGGEVPLIYLESPANPTNALVDVEAVKAARDMHFDADRCPIAIDNTFLGPLWSRPLEHGADLVVYSLTKYVGGHSDPRRRQRFRQEALHRCDPCAAQHHGRYRGSEHCMDAAPLARNGRTAHGTRRQERREGVRIPEKPSQGGRVGLSRHDRRRAPTGHLRSPLPRRGFHFQRLHQRRRSGMLPLP